MTISFNSTTKEIELTPSVGVGDSWNNAYTFEDISDYFDNNPISDWTEGEGLFEGIDINEWSIRSGSGSLSVSTSKSHEGSESLKLTKGDNNDVHIKRYGDVIIRDGNENIEYAEFWIYVSAETTLKKFVVNTYEYTYWREIRFIKNDITISPGSWQKVRINFRDDLADIPDDDNRAFGRMGLKLLSFIFGGSSGTDIYIDDFKFGRENHQTNYYPSEGKFVTPYHIEIENGCYLKTKNELINMMSLGQFGISSPIHVHSGGHFKSGEKIDGVPQNGSVLTNAPYSAGTIISGENGAEWFLYDTMFLIRTVGFDVPSSWCHSEAKTSQGEINGIQCSNSSRFVVSRLNISITNAFLPFEEWNCGYGNGLNAEFSDVSIGQAHWRAIENCEGYDTNAIMVRWTMNDDTAPIKFSAITGENLVIAEDCDFDNDKVYIDFSGGSSGDWAKLWAVSTLNLKVMNSSGNPIEGVKVTVEDKNGVAISPETGASLENIETDANGEISEKITYRKWSMEYEDGTGFYSGTSKNPFKITMSKNEYQTEIWQGSITEAINWEVVMLKEQPAQRLGERIISSNKNLQLQASKNMVMQKG